MLAGSAIAWRQKTQSTTAISSTKAEVYDVVSVGIQTAALLVTHWISYGYPARNKRGGYLFEFTNHPCCDLNIQNRCRS